MSTLYNILIRSHSSNSGSLLLSVDTSQVWMALASVPALVIQPVLFFAHWPHGFDRGTLPRDAIYVS